MGNAALKVPHKISAAPRPAKDNTTVLARISAAIDEMETIRDIILNGDPNKDAPEMTTAELGGVVEENESCQFNRWHGEMEMWDNLAAKKGNSDDETDALNDRAVHYRDKILLTPSRGVDAAWVKAAVVLNYVEDSNMDLLIAPMACIMATLGRVTR